MDPESMKMLAAAIVMGVGSIGPALGEAHVMGKALDNMGRNPEMAGQLSTSMIIGAAIIESIAIYALVIGLVILFA